MPVLLRIDLNARLYLRDPLATALGRRLVAESVGLLDEIGLEQFTFKKLACRMASTEASLYRYFENKHRLLVYLTSWYWAGLRCQIRFHTHNVTDPARRLRLILGVFAGTHHPPDPAASLLDEAALHRIVVKEAAKIYLTPGLGPDNAAGLFREYQRLVVEVAAVVTELAPAYAYPRTLAGTLLEAARQQHFVACHLPVLTDAVPANAAGAGAAECAGHAPYRFLESLAFGVLR